MKKILLANATIVNQNKEFLGSVLISGNTIEEVFVGAIPHSMNLDSIEYIDCSGKYIFPGIIDDQVHFREPGLTHKGTIKSESKAAVAGGITSYMEMPNVIPQTTTIQNLEEKFALAARDSYANYSFYIGATNSNIDQLKAIDKRITCGVKVFMGSSTGNMLVDNDEALTAIFKNVKIPIATHCEDETTIRKNLEHYTHIYGDAIPIQFHPLIRSREACMKSSSFAVQLAKKHNARLHILHVSTADELQLFESGPVSNKQITAEVCVHHLWFSADDYHTKGANIKWNPAIKNKEDRDALQQALCSNIIDIVATDHAPHLYNEKTGNYTSAASGGPLVQHSLLAMLDLHAQNIFSLSEIVTKMCHAPAELFTIYKRGYIAKGMFADIVVVDLHKKTHVTPDSLLYTCGWSPFNGHTFSSTIDKTFVNGQLVYANGQVHDVQAATHLIFSR